MTDLSCNLSDTSRLATYGLLVVLFGIGVGAGLAIWKDQSNEHRLDPDQEDRLLTVVRRNRQA